MPNTGSGDPGHRTRDSRSGLDPVDANAEAGREIGVLLARLMRGQMRPRGLPAIAAMAVLGAALILPLIAAAVEMRRYDGVNTGIGALVVLLLAALIGALLLVNAVRSLIHRRD